MGRIDDQFLAPIIAQQRQHNDNAAIAVEALCIHTVHGSMYPSPAVNNS